MLHAFICNCKNTSCGTWKGAHVIAIVVCSSTSKWGRGGEGGALQGWKAAFFSSESLRLRRDFHILSFQLCLLFPGHLVRLDHWQISRRAGFTIYCLCAIFQLCPPPRTIVTSATFPMDHLKLYAPIFLVVTSNLAVVSYELVLNCSEVSLSGITAYQNTCFAKPPTFDPIVLYIIRNLCITPI